MVGKGLEIIALNGPMRVEKGWHHRKLKILAWRKTPTYSTQNLKRS
jgi:hypothetical protein